MNLPNYITLFRIFLVPFFFGFLVYYNDSNAYFRLLAISLFLIAVLTDALDGSIARQSGQQTQLGTFLDPLADKLLLLSGFFGILLSKGLILKPPLWVVIIIVFRDLLIVCGLAIIFLTTSQIQIRPNLVGKTTTFFQMLTILTVLIGWTHASWIWVTTALLTVVSCVAYLFRGIRLVNSPRAG